MNELMKLSLAAIYQEADGSTYKHKNIKVIGVKQLPYGSLGVTHH